MEEDFHACAICFDSWLELSTGADLHIQLECPLGCRFWAHDSCMKRCGRSCIFHRQQTQSNPVMGPQLSSSPQTPQTSQLPLQLQKNKIVLRSVKGEELSFDSIQSLHQRNNKQANARFMKEHGMTLFCSLCYSPKLFGNVPSAHDHAIQCHYDVLYK